jgi:hypothetical protein
LKEGMKLPQLFILKKLHFNRTPRTSDLDNARSLLYDCSGGYPIGIFLQVLKRFALRFPAPHIIDSVERNEKIAKAEQL